MDEQRGTKFCLCVWMEINNGKWLSKEVKGRGRKDKGVVVVVVGVRIDLPSRGE